MSLVVGEKRKLENVPDDNPAPLKKRRRATRPAPALSILDSGLPVEIWQCIFSHFDRLDEQWKMSWICRFFRTHWKSFVLELDFRKSFTTKHNHSTSYGHTSFEYQVANQIAKNGAITITRLSKFTALRALRLREPFPGSDAALVRASKIGIHAMDTRWPSLQTLHVNTNSITLRFLSFAPNLTSLNVESVRDGLFSETPLDEIAKVLPHLRHLVYRRCSAVCRTLRGVRAFPSLRSLEMHFFYFRRASISDWERQWAHPLSPDDLKEWFVSREVPPETLQTIRLYQHHSREFPIKENKILLYEKIT